LEEEDDAEMRKAVRTFVFFRAIPSIVFEA
jgi:hypothetical protein